MSAAAGWGKTHPGRATGWPPRAPARAWVALDASDNDPARFWRYVSEALDRAGIAARRPGRRRASAGGPDMREAGLSALLNALAESDVEATIALDDYHAISEPAIHEAVAFLVEHLPGVAAGGHDLAAPIRRSGWPACARGATSARSAPPTCASATARPAAC